MYRALCDIKEGHCFYSNFKHLSYSKAKLFCQKINSYLVEPKNEIEIKRAVNVAKYLGLKKPFWTGAYKKQDNKYYSFNVNFVQYSINISK